MYGALCEIKSPETRSSTTYLDVMIFNPGLCNGIVVVAPDHLFDVTHCVDGVTDQALFGSQTHSLTERKNQTKIA